MRGGILPERLSRGYAGGSSPRGCPLFPSLVPDSFLAHVVFENLSCRPPIHIISTANEYVDSRAHVRACDGADLQPCWGLDRVLVDLFSTNPRVLLHEECERRKPSRTQKNTNDAQENSDTAEADRRTKPTLMLTIPRSLSSRLQRIYRSQR